jgi:hypothetical protein
MPRSSFAALVLFVFGPLLFISACLADDDDAKPAAPVASPPPIQLATQPTSSNPTQPSPADENHYGLFGLLDHRSAIGTDFYPNPFLVNEGDVDRELSLNWVHQEGHHAVSDQVAAEVEWSFGQLTFALEGQYLRDYSDDRDSATGIKSRSREEGIGSPSIAARHPLWEWVSADGNIDNAIVPGIEVAFPSNSTVGRTTEVVPEVFDLLRIGDHFGLQTQVGYSTLFGGDPNNLKTLEYSADFSYNFDAEQLTLPKPIVALTPILELAGERPLNRGEYNDNLTGVIGGRVELESVGPLSPRLGVGYIFPIDNGAREDFSWGVVVSFVFDL